MHIDRKDSDHLMDSYFNETRKTASLRYLRGRRRIGKSTLLKKIYEKYLKKAGWNLKNTPSLNLFYVVLQINFLSRTPVVKRKYCVG